MSVFGRTWKVPFVGRHILPLARLAALTFLIAGIGLYSSLSSNSANLMQQESPDPPDAEGPTTPEQLLRQVAEMSVAADPWERTFLLEELAHAALGINRHLSIQLAKELFAASLQVPIGWFNYRHAAQMNAVRFLASGGEVDAAMEFYLQMEAPEHIAGRGAKDDLREHALLTLLPKLVARNREESLVWAQREIPRLGAQPPFPFRAAGWVIEQLREEESFAAEALFSQAITAFQNQSEDPVARQRFVDFLLRFQDKFRQALEKKATLAAVEAILEAESPDNQVRRVRLTLKDGRVLELNSGEERLLYALMPLLAKYDEDRAQAILEQRAFLAPALQEEGEVVGEQSILVIGQHKDSRGKLEAVATKRLAWQQARSLGEKATEDLGAALDSVEEIGDVAARAAALASIASSIAHDDPRQARSLLAKARTLLEKVEDPTEHLRVLSAILAAEVRLQDPREVGSTYVAILELGEELLEQETASDPHVPLAVTTSYQRLAEATRSAASIDADARLAELQRLRNPVLQWHLMIEVARGLSRSRES